MDDVTNAKIDKFANKTKKVWDNLATSIEALNDIDPKDFNAEIAKLGFPVALMSHKGVTMGNMFLGTAIGEIAKHGGRLEHVFELIDAVGEFTVGDSFNIHVRQADVCDSFIPGMHATTAARLARTIRVGIAEVYLAMLEYELEGGEVTQDPANRMALVIAASKFMAAFSFRLLGRFV